MEKMKVEQRIITTVPVHGHQNRLIYVLTIVLIAKIIIFWLLGIRQGLYADCYPMETGIIITIIVHGSCKFRNRKIIFYAKVTL